MSKTTELRAVAGTDSTERAADIVFVHGLDGDCRLTWQQEDWEESFWPALLFNDLPTCGIWSFGYDARSSNWIHGSTMPIVDRATNFAAFMRSEGIGNKPIFFIVHSLGGLIVKQMLRSRYDKDPSDSIVSQTRGVFFFATPHGGSDLSKLVQWLKFYRPSVLVKELEFAAAPLRDLNAWYRANSERLKIQTFVFAETQKTKGTMVVDQLSSDPGIPSAEIIPVDADHGEICKVDTESMPYKTVRNAIEQFVRDAADDIELSRRSDLWMDISCFNKYPDQWEEKNIPKSEDRILRYRASSKPELVEIVPELPYLNSVRKGEPVWSIPYMWQPFRWLPLNLDLKFLNHGSETLVLTKLHVNVSKSIINTEPLLLVKRGEMFPYLSISNDGWGEIRRPTLRLALENGKGKPAFPDELPINVPVEEFTDFCEFDLSEQFAELGVDIQAIMDHQPDPVLGPFTSRMVFVYGLLNFIDTEGDQREFRFGTDMRIEGPMCAMYGPPSFEYATRLQAEGENYTIAVDISHVIQPNEFDRLLLQLDVEKSSVHDLSLEVEGNRGSVAKSQPVRLSIFMPRSVREQLPDTDETNPFMFK